MIPIDVWQADRRFFLPGQSSRAEGLKEDKQRWCILRADHKTLVFARPGVQPRGLEWQATTRGGCLDPLFVRLHSVGAPAHSSDM